MTAIAPFFPSVLTIFSHIGILFGYFVDWVIVFLWQVHSLWAWNILTCIPLLLLSYFYLVSGRADRFLIFCVPPGGSCSFHRFKVRKRCAARFLFPIAALVSRQFVDMSRIRIEGLLAAFPKLVGTGKQHTYVETENVRYVYQPIEGLYLLLITNKQSNILEDLDTLRLLSKLVPEYSPSLDEEGVCKTAFELIFAFDEAISLGNKENVTVQQVKQYCEMESHEEKAHKLMMQAKINETKDVMKKKANELDKLRVCTSPDLKYIMIPLIKVIFCGWCSLQMERGKLDKGGYSSISGPRVIEKTFSDMSISGSGLGGLSTDMDSFASKPKGGRPSTAATAPGKGLGMKLGKTQKTNQFLESLKAEGEVILEDVQPSSVPTRSPALPPTDPVTVTIEEKLNVVIKRDGGINNFDVQGTLALQVLNDTDGFIQLQIESQDIPGLSFKTHPNINKELFNSQQILGAKDPNRPFPSGQNETPLVKWRIQGMDESSLPLSVNCWPSVSGNETYVNIEYEASEMFDLHNVVISIPLPALREAPSVKQIDGDWKFDSRNSVLEWSILLIDQSNRSGSMEFVVPAADPSSFFPISVGFSASGTFSDLKVTGIHPLKEGNPPKFSHRARLLTANYQVV
ncbi:Coatomer subunit delta-1 [Dichanthelium oligosanthes]|uniref:Coatomer subunit delta n=1 Tax=Dichanthelium oligosanthes TaxID=888268 RepID=A0A1E5VBD7_9POAL|nr:Coatomer subunit delta-1 [Dichanthelium oligosanthes]